MQCTGHIRMRETAKGKSYQLIIEQPPDIKTGKRKRKYITLGNVTKKQAEKALRKIIDDMENDEYIDRDGVTVIEWVNKWMELFMKNISPTTRRGYENQIKIYIGTQPIADMLLQSVKTEDVQEWINTISASSPVTGKPLSGKTVKNVFMNLSAAYNKAVELDKVKRNPCKGVSIPKCKKYQGEVYDDKDIAKLLECANGTDMELPLKLLLTLGLRRGELLALKWSRIDFEKHTVLIDENLVYVDKSISKDGYIIKSPKSLSGIRTLYITDRLLELLKKQREVYLDMAEKSKDFQDNEFVICQSDGKAFTPNAMTRKFNRFLEKNNLKKIRLHDLRHTNATLMMKNGISAKEAQKRLGHADVSVTLDTYSHVLDSMQQATADKIESAILH